MSRNDDHKLSSETGQLQSERLGLEATHTAPGKLKLWQAIAIAIVGLQLGPTMALVGGGLFVLIGYGSWISILIGLAMTLGVCEGIRLVSQADRSAKGLMNMVAASLGEKSALYVRTSLIIGYVACAAACVTSADIFSISIMGDFGWSWGASTTGQIVSTALISLASTAIAYRGLEASLKTSMILGFACFPIVGLLIGLSVIHTGLDLRTQFSMDEATLSRSLIGAVIVVAGIMGIDGIASLADDTDQPARNVSRIVFGTFTLVGLGLLVACVTETPMMAASVEAMRLGLSPTAVLARTAGLPALAVFVDLFLFLGSFAASFTMLTYGSRLFADAANANLLPAVFSQLHHRFGSNHKSVILLGAAQAFVPIASALFFRAPPLLSSIYITASVAYLWAIPHLMICVGGMRVALRARSPNILSYLALAVSIVGFVAMLLIALTRPNDDWQGLVSRISIASSTVFFMAYCVKARTGKPT